MKHEEWMDLITDLVDENFPKGECAERGNALVLVAELTIKLQDLGLIGERTTETILAGLEANLDFNAVAIGQNPFDS